MVLNGTHVAGPQTQIQSNMTKPLAIALLIGGVVLLAFGISASTSFSSDVSKFFTGSPTDKAIWMVLGGAVAAGVGLFFTLRSGKGA